VRGERKLMNPASPNKHKRPPAVSDEEYERATTIKDD
jgi:hypothetical protein